MTGAKAQGFSRREPVAVIDIGSNSVRLVVYERLVCSPTVLFNEKILCGLGKGLAKTGWLKSDSVDMALRTLKRFRVLCRQLDVRQIYTLATAAAREAKNGPDFIAEAEAILGVPVQLLTGPEEAAYSACGILASFYKPDGVVGDMGGGSVELVDIDRASVGDGITLPLGGLRLRDMSDKSLSEATMIARRHLRKTSLLKAGRGQNFYAVGGTWRNLAKLHMNLKHYPLPVMHAYEIEAHEAENFLHRVLKGEIDRVRGISAVSKSRRQLLPYGAIVLLELMHVMKPEKIVFSGYGMREGYLYSLLSKSVRQQDPLLSAAEEVAVLRSRSPQHAHELIDWTRQAFKALDIKETENEKRYREASCLLADIGWRISPEYRGIQAASQIAYGAYPAIDHPGRIFAALAVFFRNEGLVSDSQAPDIIKLSTPHITGRARLLGAIMRISNLLCASSAGILPQIAWKKTKSGIVLDIPARYRDLIADRPEGRLRKLSELVDVPMKFRIKS